LAVFAALPGRQTVRLSDITQERETHAMETTIRKRIEVEGQGVLDGEFIQNEQGWFCREVNGVRWNFRDWGAPAPMDTPEEAAIYLLSLDVEETDY
jgi:hypothetical protein